VDIGYSDYTCSIVEFRKGELAVKATTFDRHFGGRNLDKALVDHFAAEFKEKFKLDITTNAKATTRVAAAAEKLKKILSANAQAPLSIESLMDDKDVRAMLKREELEELVKPLLDRVTGPLEQALAEAKLKVEDIDAVEMVGGCTRVPGIKDRISKFFGKTLSGAEQQRPRWQRGRAPGRGASGQPPGLSARHASGGGTARSGSLGVGVRIPREDAGRAQRLRVVVVESGGTERDADVDALNEIESVGHARVMDQWLVRNRLLGGSSNTWTGRCAPFDDIDYEARNWVEYSGWPFTADEMKPFLDRAAPYLGLGIGSGFSDRSFWKLFGRSGFSPELHAELLVPFFWQFSKDDVNRFDYMRFGESLRNSACEARVILNATVTNINTDTAGAAVRSVELRGRDGALREISAPRIVLCAGGIENARLLLASRRTNSAGLGNQNDLVGRFLMDHPRGRIGIFDVATSASLQKWFGVYNLKSSRGSHRFRHGFRLSPDYQRKHKLLNSAVWLNEVVTDDDPWNALSRMLRGRGNFFKDAMSVGSNLGLFAKGLNQFLIQRNGLPRKLERLELQCIVEQQPDPESRITLSERVDRFGMPISRTMRSWTSRSNCRNASLPSCAVEISMPVFSKAKRTTSRICGSSSTTRME